MSESGASRVSVGQFIAALLLCGLYAAAQDQSSVTLPRSEKARTASIVGMVRSQDGNGLGGVRLVLQPVADGSAGLSVRSMRARSASDGWFGITDVPPGVYELTATLDGYQAYTWDRITVKAGDMAAVEAALIRAGETPAAVGLRKGPVDDAAASKSSARLIVRSAPGSDDGVVTLSAGDQVVNMVRDRWKYRNPVFRRYDNSGEFQFVRGHWYDPFNASRLKGDLPIVGRRVFLNVAAVSDTFSEKRQLPFSPLPARAPAGLSLMQSALQQNFLFSADLSYGDAAYQPPDWRLRVTVGANVNYASVGKPGILNFTDPQVTRLATQTNGLQEGFVEHRLGNLSNAFDSLSVRAGIQNFNSDFRGFIFATSAPGVRLFGTLRSNRYQYNVAAFDLLIKNPNTGLNELKLRNQQVFIANLYRQDFLIPGYTIEFSAHFDKDDPSTAVNANNFQVRPVPLAGSIPHAVRAGYFGVAGDGRIGRVNVSHAFYQVLGHDTYNAIAGRPVQIDARMGAVEASLDRDWVRYRISAFYGSGDRNPHGATATGFDSILANTNFAGGMFSFWNREIINLTGSGVALTTGGGLVPDIRSGTASGQANFANPGVMLANAGVDLDLTPKLRVFLNLNQIRFADTQPLEYLMGIANIHASAGTDTGIGIRYRPALNDNVIFLGGFNMLFPGAGLRQIYSGGPFPAVFTDILFRF
jgi:hypothetical protein